MEAKDEILRMATAISSGHLPGDEPVFVLRARDWFAASAVHAWIRACKEDGRVPDEKILEAVRLHNSMLEWPTKHIPGTGNPWSEPDLEQSNQQPKDKKP